MGKKSKDKKKKRTSDGECKKEKPCKTECCEKYLKREDKRCKRCPMFDLIAKVA